MLQHSYPTRLCYPSHQPLNNAPPTNHCRMTQEKSSWTDSDVEGILDANLCRCTGYRPIVDAFKAVTVQDIEARLFTRL